MSFTIRGLELLLVTASMVATAVAAEVPVRVVVWDEQQPAQKAVYENFLGNAIADYLKSRPGFVVTSVCQNDSEQGLSNRTLDQCDVLIWWGHARQRDVQWETGQKLVERIKQGKLSLIALHSAHWSTPFIEAMNERAMIDALAKLTPEQRKTVKVEAIRPERYSVPKRDGEVTPSSELVTQPDGSLLLKVKLPNCCFPAYRADGKPGHLKTLLPNHPIARGLPATFDIPHTEMYDEHFHVPAPDEIIFEERWDAGEHFRSGAIWKIGQGRVFYFRPGHETFDVFKQPEPLMIVENAARWLADVQRKSIIPKGYSIPLIDLATETARQVIVDREPGQYLGHPSTALLEDGKTMLCVYPKGHGKGAIVYKRSTDGGLTWSDRIPVPESWATSKETPTIHRVVDAAGKKRLIVWSGMYPARLAVTEDDGQTWSELKQVGDWGGIVVMGFVEAVKNSPGHYMAMFHDDGRYFAQPAHPTKPVTFTLYQTNSKDGGLTWSAPRALLARDDVHLCEPGVIRSPDGKELAVLLRENSRRKNSHVIFSRDEGQTWTDPREVPGALTGDRHVGKYTPDGRLFISFRDTTLESKTKGDWVAWVGTYDDIAQGREGQYRVRLMKNHKGADCAYPGVELLPDGTIITTTYGHWRANELPYIVSVRLKINELDQRR